MNRRSIIEELKKSKSLRRWEVRDINLSEVDMSGIDLTGAGFSGCSLRNCRFDGASLNETRFTDCHLDGASFEGASLSDSRFESCRGLDDAAEEFLRKGGAHVVRAPRSPLGYGVLALALVLIVIVGYMIVRINAQTIDAPGSARPTDESTPAEGPKVLLARGVKAMTVEDYAKALPLLKQSVEKAPDLLEARFQLAECLLKMGKYDEAKESYEAILARNPGQDIDVPARQFLAECYQRADNSQAADKVFLAVAKKYVDSPAVVRGLVLNHANLRWKTGDHEGALALFDELLTMGTREQQAGVYLLIGLVNKDQGKRGLAKKSFRKVAGGFPGDQPAVLDARVQLALLDIEDGRRKKALASLTGLLRKGADQGQVFNALFQIYRQDQKDGGKKGAREFLATLEELFRSSSRHLATVYVEYGKLAMEEEDMKAALGHFEKVVALSKDPIQSAWASESIEEILRRETQERLKSH